jgi:outer membrane protein assembly factor BamB
MPDASNFVGGAATGGVLMNDRLIVGSMIGRLYAVRLADGVMLWERDAGGPQQPIPNRLLNLDGNAVFFRLDGHLEAVRPANGERVWQGQIGSYALGDLQYCNPFLCFAEGQVFVMRRTGALEWTTMGSGAADVVFLSNVEVDADGIMYAGIVRTGERTSIIAFEPPVRVGRTSLTAY